METTDNIAIKTAVARLLATENIDVRIDASAKTASFDMKTRVLRLPRWSGISNELYDMLLVHEVGHALDTPYLELVDAHAVVAVKGLGRRDDRAKRIAHDYLNVVEDARIDKRQMRRYPGAKRDYTKGYAELIERNFLGTEGVPLAKLNKRNFIDRFNIYFKGGRLLGLAFSAIEKAFLKEAETLETWSQVVDLASRILKYAEADHKLKEKKKIKIKPENLAPQNEDGDSSPEGSEDPDFEYEVEEEKPKQDPDDATGGDESAEKGDKAEDEADASTAPAEEEAQPDVVEENDKSEAEEEDQPGSGATPTPTQDEVDEAITSESSKIWGDNINSIAVAGQSVTYIELPKFDMSVGVDDFTVVMADYAKYMKFSPNFNSMADFQAKMEATFQTWKMGEKSSIGYMISQFEMRKAADEYSRTSQSRTGLLDMRKLHSYKYNDDLFLQETIVADGKSHGFVMFIDWSSSMIGNLHKTVKQLLSLVMFCDATQIPFEVYSFRDNLKSEDYNETKHPFGISLEMPRLEISNFRLRNLLSSRMGRVRLNKAMVNLWAMSLNPYNNKKDMLNSTPLEAAILAGSDVINAFKTRTGVQIVNTIILTDGDSNRITPVTGYGATGEIYYTDPVTKKKYKYKMGYMVKTTPLYLNILKDRTGCNLVGFFLTGGEYDSTSIKNIQNTYFRCDTTDAEWNAARKSWKEDAFIEVKSEGYDSYFVIDAKGSYNSGYSPTIESGKVTAKEIAKNLMKTTKIKMQNRNLLKKYISLIAS